MNTNPHTGKAQLLDCEMAAEYLGLSPITLADWRMQSKGPKFAKLGRRVKYDVADLDTFIEQNKS